MVTQITTVIGNVADIAIGNRAVAWNAEILSFLVLNSRISMLANSTAFSRNWHETVEVFARVTGVLSKTRVVSPFTVLADSRRTVDDAVYDHALTLGIARFSVRVQN